MLRSPSWLALVVAASLVLPAAAQDAKGKGKGGKKGGQTGAPMKVEDSDTPLGRETWKADFDYTHLAPPTETLWASMTKATVEMEAAIATAGEALGGTVWVKRADLAEHEGQLTWDLELFIGSPENDQPRRVDVRASATEAKVLARTDLPELSAEDRQVWNGLAKASVPAETCIATSKANARGSQAEAKITEPHMRKLEFVSTERSYWDCEMMGIEGGLPRRYKVEVWSDQARLRMRSLMDRFPGTPLRRNHPTELPNGMFLYDFTTGDGQQVARESKVRVHYRLFLLDNSKLHDTWSRNLPETFLVTEAPLKGMTEGMVGMRVGGKRKIAMTYDVAFGEAGNEIVPPKAMVVCDVYVEEVVGP